MAFSILILTLNEKDNIGIASTLSHGVAMLSYWIRLVRTGRVRSPDRRGLEFFSVSSMTLAFVDACWVCLVRGWEGCEYLSL